MFASALTSRSTPLWRSVCSTRSRPPCRSRAPRSRRRNGRHRSLPARQRLRCRSPAPAPSTDRPSSRPDPAVLDLRVAVGDPALDEPAGKTAARPLSTPGHRAQRRRPRQGPNLPTVVGPAQPVSRFTIDDVIHDGDQISLRLGDPPSAVPEPVAALVLEYLGQRTICPTTTVLRRVDAEPSRVTPPLSPVG
jgi:hypothetical protein